MFGATRAYVADGPAKGEDSFKFELEGVDLSCFIQAKFEAE